jgi:hypothetical protein
LTLANHPQLRELELTYFAGDPVYIAIASPTDTAIISLKYGAQTTLDSELVKSVVSRAATPYQIIDSRVVNRYEAYYVDRLGQKRLPVLRVRLDDPQHSLLYIDLHDGRVALSYNRIERWDRWLYQGLHDFDVPWLYRHRPLWDMVVIVRLAGGNMVICYEHHHCMETAPKFSPIILGLFNFDGRVEEHIHCILHSECSERSALSRSSF